ncbi:MAG: orotate phosphoribosyltransferase [Oscillospiraceae bacterium]|jgi:orotate phosphoribosyltransferase|nr:orotate phosphoribosyltransferase [Oscillospiraceae bacterium]
MLTQDEALGIMKGAGALLQGHFLLASGRHSSQYMQCARLFERPEYAEALCASLAEAFASSGARVTAGPAVGAVALAYELSRLLRCRNIFAERRDGAFAFRRGFTLAEGERVLVVEDVVTTGGSAREVLRLCREAGAEPVGVGCIVDRSGGLADFGVPLKSVLTADLPSWESRDCPLCARGLPCEKPGSSPP